MPKTGKMQLFEIAYAHRPLKRRKTRLCPVCASVALRHDQTGEVRCAKNTCEHNVWQHIHDWNSRLSESEKRILTAAGVLE